MTERDLNTLVNNLRIEGYDEEEIDEIINEIESDQYITVSPYYD